MKTQLKVLWWPNGRLVAKQSKSYLIKLDPIKAATMLTVTRTIKTVQTI